MNFDIIITVFVKFDEFSAYHLAYIGMSPMPNFEYNPMFSEYYCDFDRKNDKSIQWIENRKSSIYRNTLCMNCMKFYTNIKHNDWMYSFELYYVFYWVRDRKHR